MREKSRRSTPWWKKALGIVWWSAVMSVACLGGVVGYMASKSSLFRTAITNPFAILNVDPKETFRDYDGLTLLILGTDETRRVTGWAREKDGQEHAISVPTGISRADMILVAKLDFDKKTITGLSIPRDTAFRLPDFDGKSHRINGYYSLAQKGEEKSTMTRAVEYILPGVKIDRTIAINYDAFKELVDTVGGVPVVVPKGPEGKGLYYNDYSGGLHVDLKPGAQTLNGEEAMGYVRFRHDKESDYGRQDRQKQFLASFKSAVFRHPFQLADVAEGGKRAMGNALDDQEIIALLSFARKVPPTSIKLGMLPTYPKGKVLHVTESKRDEALREFNLLSGDSRTAAVER